MTAFTFIFLTIIEYAIVVNVKWNIDNESYINGHVSVKNLRKRRERKRQTSEYTTQVNTPEQSDTVSKLYTL